jgi:hypothetical protein
MSERGSFCTEYVYCTKCLEVLRRHLLKDEKHFRGFSIPMWTGCTTPGDLPIIAGKIGGMAGGEEIIAMEFEYGEPLNAELCHRVRIAVMAESGQSKFLVFGPEENA